MRLRPILTAALACLAFAGTAAGEYDFFAGARYPGPVKKGGVDLYKVTRGGGAGPKAYERREVVWWPRKGVDIIEVKDAMPPRTWTLRDRTMDPGACAEHPILGMEQLTRRLPWKQPRRFKAHLIGFRGLGNRYGNPFGIPRSYYCPAVVLRLEDGTKRCFVRGTLIEKDERAILALYVKEIQRTRATLSKAKYEISGGWPDSAKPGQPGTMRVESEHFVWFSGSQAPPGEGNPWVDAKAPEKTRLYREGSVAFAEDMWAYQEHAGVLMPFWDRYKQYKYGITVCGTYRDGYIYIGGYAGGGYGGCAIKDAGGGPWSLGLAHEWGHGVPLQTRVDGGGGEILADACQVVDDPARTEKFANNVRRPWRNCVHGSYGTGLFYGMMGDDPNWGYAMVITLPVGAGEPSIFHTLARLGEQRGLFANGIRGVGDMMGEFAARQAEFDCELQDTLRRAFISVKRNYLEAVDRKAGLYRIPWAEAPEPFGANIIRLVPAKGAKRIAVDFRGFYDPDTYSDWRACIVAVDAEGKVRYSPMWSKGVMEMAARPGDRRFWLTVAATPYALPRIPGRGGGVGVLLDGRHAYRYPYEVKLRACRPGTPHNLPGDTEDYQLAYLDGHRRRDTTGSVCVIPHPGDTPEAAILRKTIPALRSRLDKFKEETARLTADGKISTGNWWYYRRFGPHLAFLDQYVSWMEDGIQGRRHPNGGGWVANSARVAPSAYVAQDAMVLDGAKVLGHAAIEDYAVVRGPKAVVSGYAKVSGQAYVAGNVKIGGYTRVLHPIDAVDERVMSDEMPLRPFQETKGGQKLWANYAMDRDETEVLEDWFRYRDHHGIRWQFDVLNLNGHLYGRPEFVVDGERRGFRFDGRTQYAEASPILADLGEITVDVVLKWEGGKNQAVFDFGSSADNRFVLTPAGASGKAELAITRGGKTERVLADAALPKNTWARCRLEIDGKKIALWIDGRKAVQKASGFRPADVYPGGVEKRNFIAAARDATGHFKGSLDYLRVYHTVYDDFARSPEPRQHAPRRVSREFIDSCKKRYSGGNRLVEELVKAKIALDYGSYYQEIGSKMGQRKREIENSNSSSVEPARRKLGEIERKLARRRKELIAEFDSLPETIKSRDEVRKLEDKARALQAKRKEVATALETRLKAKYKAEEKAPTAEDKALIEANERILADAKEKKEQAKAQVQRLEKSFKALGEIARLQARIDDFTARAKARSSEILNRPELKETITQADKLRGQWDTRRRELRKSPQVQALEKAAGRKRRQRGELERKIEQQGEMQAAIEAHKKLADESRKIDDAIRKMPELVKLNEAVRQEKDRKKRRELEAACRDLLNRKTREHPGRAKVIQQRDRASREISQVRQRLRNANPQWVELSKLADELPRQANDTYARLCAEDPQLTGMKQQEQRLREEYSDMLRSLKDNDPDLSKWTTQPPRLKALLAFKLAELRVNTPEYVRWWRMSEASAPRIVDNVASNRTDIRSSVANDPRIVKLDREITRCQTNARALRPDSRPYVAKRTVELNRQVGKAKMEVGDALKKNIGKYGLEHNWLASMGWQYGSGFYNKPYASYLQDLAREAIGREDQECHENFGSLESIYRLQSTTGWHTRCDWEWRLRQELDGSIKELPLLRKWLQRVRGMTGK